MNKILNIVMALFLRLCLAPVVIGLFGLIVFDRFWATFCLAFGINFILGYLINMLFSTVNAKRIIEFEKMAMEHERTQSISVSCAYCNGRNQVPLTLNVNGFDCKSCGKTNRLFLQFRTAQITEFDENAGVPTMKDAIITEIPK